MKRTLLLLLCAVGGGAAVAAAPAGDTLFTGLLRQHLVYLASDSLKGRGNYTEDLHRAAAYIAGVFEQHGLAPLSPLPSYYQPFTSKKLAKKKLVPDSGGAYDPANVLLNVVGVLPGKSRPGEVVLFSAHYDHVGGRVTRRGDRIFNGANDNASGTAALLALARYYALCNDNERTLVFCAFAGEELGLLGSQYFAGGINSEAIKAVINIEMIGRYHHSIGKDAFYLTGAEHSNLAAIFEANLEGSGIRIAEEPDAEKQLFRRSDNYPFAQKGIPAHTLMRSDDEDECYHGACDEVARMDLNNMERIVRAIVRGSESIVQGSATPTRIHRSVLD